MRRQCKSIYEVLTQLLSSIDIHLGFFFSISIISEPTFSLTFYVKTLHWFLKKKKRGHFPGNLQDL